MKKNLFCLRSFFISLLLLLLSTEIVLAELINPLYAETFEEFINAIIGFLWEMAIPLAVLIIIIGAFYMATSLGKPEQFEKGKKVIFYAFIGLIVIIVARGIIPFIRDFFAGL